MKTVLFLNAALPAFEGWNILSWALLVLGGLWLLLSIIVDFTGHWLMVTINPLPIYPWLAFAAGLFILWGFSAGTISTVVAGIILPVIGKALRS